MKSLKEITATALRQRLFQVLQKAPKNLPTRVRYKKGDSIILSYDQYLDLAARQVSSSKKSKRKPKALKPLVNGKVLKSLDEKAEKALLRYMGIK